MITYIPLYLLYNYYLMSAVVLYTVMLMMWCIYSTLQVLSYILYNQKYWQLIYLMIRSKNVVGKILSTAWKESHAYSLYGVHLNWRSLCNLQNRQIKMTAKYSGFTVLEEVKNFKSLQSYRYFTAGWVIEHRWKSFDDVCFDYWKS